MLPTSFFGNLSLVAILPNKVDGLAALAKGLTGTKLTDWLGRLREEEVEVRFPKFRVTGEMRLEKTLAEMGMPLAFGKEADFSSIDGSHDLFLSAVVHQAFMEFIEEGTEAAAASGAAIATKSELKNPVFNADHPFIFLIRDSHNENILFLGRLSDPKNENGR